MKKLSLVFALTAMTFSAFACDDDSSNSNNNAGNFCDDMCAKDVECDPEYDLQECLSECGSMAPLMLDSFIDSIGACYESNTCEEMETMDPGCAELAASGCNTGTEDLAAAYCEKDFECEGETPTVDEINACVEAIQSGGDFAMMACYRPAPLAAYTDCISNVECTTAEADFDACAADHLGMVSDN